MFIHKEVIKKGFLPINYRLLSGLLTLVIFLLTSCGSPDESSSTQSDSDGDTETTSNQIAFTSATQTTLSTQGIGGDTESILTFTITDDSGAPVSGITVDFTINDTADTGAVVSATNPISDSNGEITVTVSSDDTAGTITVTATIADSTEAATSDLINIIGLTADNNVSFISTSTVTLDHLGSGGTEQATLTFAITNINDIPVADTMVNFTLSDPHNTGASLENSSAVSDSEGAASVTVNSGTTDGEFTITATIDGTTISATSPPITVTDLATDRLTFVSTSTDTLAFKDSGGIDQAILLFNISDEQGDPLPGVTVTFSVNGAAGSSITLAEPSEVSDASGNVTAIVQSGTVPGVFSVAAAVNASTTITSEPLTVSAGLPVQDSLSLSANPLNPANAHDTDGIEVDINIIASDALGNSVPDGTEIRFVSPESGNIDPASCETDGGECSVIWTSSNPRPDDGRLSILAYANGVEEFTDNNANGVFDTGVDTFDDVNDDLGEAFADEDEDDNFDTGEFFFDANENGSRDDPDGEWTTEGVVVYSNIFLRLSNDSPQILTTNFPEQSVIDVSGGLVSLELVLSDSNDNPLPIGTTIDFEANNGEIVGPDSFTVANTGFPINVPIIINPDGDPGHDGDDTLLLTVETPDGTPTLFFWKIFDGGQIFSSSIDPGDELDISGGNEILTVTLGSLPLDTTMNFTTTNGTIVGSASNIVTGTGNNQIEVELTTDGTSDTDADALTLTVTTPAGTVDTYRWDVTD